MTDTPPDDRLDRRAALDRSMATGLAWTGTSKWTMQIVSWAMTIYVAHILTPDDYGIVGMAGVFVTWLQLATEFGIGTTVTTMRHLTHAQLAQLNGFALLLGAAGTVVTLMAAWPLSWFFRTPDLIWVVMALSAGLAFNALQPVPIGLLRRDLRFRALAVFDIARGVCVPATTLTLAWLGFHYWSLVIGTLLSSFISSVVALSLAGHAFAWPRRTTLATLIAFSRDIVIGRVAWSAYSEADMTVAGRRLGSEALGIYYVAGTIANTPVDKLLELLTEVTPAIFAAARHDRAELRRYFLNMTEMIAVVTFPVAIGIALVSTDLVPVLLGDKWASAVVPLRIIAAYAAVHAITLPYSHVLIVTEQTAYARTITILTAIVMTASFVVGSYWGLKGLAAAWVVSHPIMTIPVLIRVARELRLSLREYVQCLRIGLDSALAMVVAVLVVHHMVPAEWTGLVRLLIDVGTGATSYVGAALLIHPSRLSEVRAWVSRVRAR